jgi:hypothetical protein
MRKRERASGRQRQIVYLDNDVWADFAKWAEGTGISRSRWMEILMRELAKDKSGTVIERMVNAAVRVREAGETIRKK